MFPERPIKLLHVIPSIGFARGGPSVVVRTMARYLVERGLEVHNRDDRRQWPRAAVRRPTPAHS